MENYSILKTCCRYIYRIYNGNFWYEQEEIGNDQRLVYRIGIVIAFFSYTFMTFMEILAALIGEFPEEEKREAMSLAFSHTIVLIKIYLVVLNKPFIRDLNHKMVTLCQTYEKAQVMEEKYKLIKVNILAYCLTVAGSMTFFLFEGLRKMYTGSHFVTAVTYYPAYEDNSAFATFLRILNTILFYVMMLTMVVTVDAFAVIYIIMYKYKFITLRHYFENLREEVETWHNMGKDDMAAEKLATGLIKGIVMHSNILSLSKEIDNAFGTVIALQVFESSGTAVVVLLQIFLDDLTFVAKVKLVFFVIALFFILGLFLCNAGEMTHEAALISHSIFYCGWSMCPGRPEKMPNCNIRHLVLLALVQSQRPLVMMAFKMLELTYETYLQVLRGTYSVFALVYAQNE